MRPAWARRLCRSLVVTPTRFDAYAEASRELFAIFERTGAVVQRGSIEEAFLDVAGLGLESIDQVEAFAAGLRSQAREQACLPVSIGLASTKVLAKLASRAAKPDGLRVVSPGEEMAFLFPLPVGQIWGIGPATAGKLHAAGLHTVGQVMPLEEAELMAILGKAAGRYVHAIASNRDPRPVRRHPSRRSFGAQRSLAGPRADEPPRAALAAVVGRVAARLQKARRAGRTITVHVRFGYDSRIARSHSLTHSTSDAAEILAAALPLLQAALDRGAGRLTLVGVAVSNLDARGVERQLDFSALAQAG